MATFANSGTAGYWAGRWTSPTTGNLIQKLTFSTEARTTIAATLADSIFGASGASNNAVAGYIAGGVNGAAKSYIQKLDYATETRTTITATLSTARNYTAGMADSGTL